MLRIALVFFFLPGMIFGLKCYGCKKIWYNDALYYSSQLDCSIIRDCDEGITSCISGTLEQIPGMNEYDMYHVKGCAGSANSWNIEETCEKTVASSKSYDVKLETCTIEKCGEDLCNTQATDDIFSWRDDWEKNRPAPVDLGATVECDGNKMTLKWSYELDLINLHLLDDKCKFDKNVQELEVTLDQTCGTTVSYDASNVYYQNKVIGTSEVQDAGGASLVRGDSMELTVKCAFKRTGNPTYVSWEIQGQNTVTKTVEGDGSLIFTLRVFKSSSALWSQRAEKIFPVTFSSNDDVYMEVAVDSRDSDSYSLIVVNIVASDSVSGEFVDKVYYIVENGCKRDSTFSYIDGGEPDGGDPKKKQFTLKAFSFLESETPVYIHTTVKICEKDDKSCEDLCSENRKKRAVTRRNVEDDRSEQYHVSQGPFVARDPVQNIETSGEERCRFSVILFICLLMVILRDF